MAHTPLLLHDCIYSYQLFSNLKDGIGTPMAQQVCFEPVSLTGLLLSLALYLFQFQLNKQLCSHVMHITSVVIAL